MDIKKGDWIVLDIDYMENEGWNLDGLDSSPFKVEEIMKKDGFSMKRIIITDRGGDIRVLPETCIMYIEKTDTIIKKITELKNIRGFQKGDMISLYVSEMISEGHYCSDGLNVDGLYEIIKVNATTVTILDDDFDERDIAFKYIKEIIGAPTEELEITGEPLEELKLTEGLMEMEKESLEIDDMINPNHYKQGKYEVIDIIESITGEQFEGYLAGNIIKYVGRYKYKNGLEDLRKAQWYLEKLIDTLE